MTCEREVEAYLIKRIKELGGEVRKVKWLGRNGAPDRLVLLPLRYDEDVSPPQPIPANATWVELKRPDAKAKPHQLREHERLRSYGATVFVLDSEEAIDSTWPKTFKWSVM